MKYIVLTDNTTGQPMLLPKCEITFVKGEVNPTIRAVYYGAGKMVYVRETVAEIHAMLEEEGNCPQIAGSGVRRDDPQLVPVDLSVPVKAAGEYVVQFEDSTKHNDAGGSWHIDNSQSWSSYTQEGRTYRVIAAWRIVWPEVTQ